MELKDNNKVPPIITQYIQNSFDMSLPPHVRDNYRDLILSIRDLLNNAVLEFDRKSTYRNKNAVKKPK